MVEVEPGKFNREVAAKGYALNRMGHSLNEAANRRDFATDPDAYCTRFGLSDEERAAVRSRDKRQLFAAGGNMYFMAKLDRVPKPQPSTTDGGE